MSTLIPSYHAGSIRALKDLVLKHAGERLAGERELAQTLHVSRPVLRAMLTDLEKQGLVMRRHGSGTYATDRSSGQLSRVTILIDSRLKLGEDPFFSIVSERLMREAQERGIRCTSERITDHTSGLELQDGAVAMGLAAQRLLEEARLHAAPVIGLFMPAEVKPATRASVFQLEDRDGGAQAALWLLNAGCKRLLFFGRNEIPASKARYEGALAVAKEHKVKLDMVPCGLNFGAGMEVARSYAWPGIKETIGVIAANDWMAVGLQGGLASRGAKWIKRIKLASFDGLPLAAHPSLGIASFAVPVETIVKDVFAELQRLAQNPSAPGRTLRYAFLPPK